MNILKKVHATARLRKLKARTAKLHKELKRVSNDRKRAIKTEMRKLSKHSRVTKRKPAKRKRRRY